MAKADVLAIVTNLSNGQANPTLISQFYDDVVRDLGRDAWLTDAIATSVAAGQSLVQLPDTTITPQMQIFNGTQLGELNLQKAIWLYGQAWTTASGIPLDVVYEAETRKSFRLLPAPSANGTLTTITSEYRADVPNYLQWPIALLVFEIEFSRESDHKNAALAKVAGDLGRLMLAMLV